MDSADQEPSRPRTVPHTVFGLMVPVTETGRVAVVPEVIGPMVQIVTVLLPPVLREEIEPALGAPYAAPVHALAPPWAETSVKFLQARTLINRFQV